MAGFNKVKVNTPNATSYEGGAVYKKSAVDQWLTLLFSSFLEDKFYESAKEQRDRFLELTQAMADEYGYEFVAKAATFARNELGMRSISQLVAAWLNPQSFSRKRAFYSHFMHRPDDVAEIFAAVEFLGDKRSHGLVRGSADYLSSLSDYSIGKYKLQSRKFNMYDLINLTHAWSPAIDRYKNDTLVAPDTWEVSISTASEENRSKEWKRLVEEHKLGYMALLRNLNNILSCDSIDAEWLEKVLCPQLVDEVAIKKSLVFPYRIYNAYRNLRIYPLIVTASLSRAFAIAVKNMPTFDGSTAVLLDVSGSMDSLMSNKSNITIKQIGACFAVAIFLANPNATIVKFGTRAQLAKLNKLDDPFRLIDSLCRNDGCGYGTEIVPAFDLAKKMSSSYDRMFIISDMQVMDGGWYYSSVPVNVFHMHFNQTPVYSFDLGGYATQILSKSDHIRYCTALNEQVFKFIGLLESKINLVDYINNFNYC